MARFYDKDKRCYLVFAYGPPGLPKGDANTAFNAYIADTRRGLVLYHDHFVGQPGGVAILYIETEAQHAALHDSGPLDGWQMHCHPLVYSGDAVGFIAQVAFTLRTYRQRDLHALMAAYAAGDD